MIKQQTISQENKENEVESQTQEKKEEKEDISVEQETIQGTERAIEIRTISLQSRLKEGDLVDIRIQYPNGEEYVVISKRQCHELSLEEGRVTLFLTEEEILRFSSSMVDCVQQNGTLYTARYLRNREQDAAIITYMPSRDIMDLIKKDPNIMGEASSVLEEKARSQLEERLVTWEANKNEESINEEPVWSESEEREGGYYVD